MTTTFWAVVIPALAAIIGAPFAYWKVVRGQRGDVRTSSAEEVWAEARQNRTNLATDVIELRERVARLEGRIDDRDERIEQMADENRKLKRVVDGLASENTQLRERIEEMAERLGMNPTEAASASADIDKTSHDNS